MAKVEDRALAPNASLNDDIGEETRLRMYRMQVEIREAEQRAFDLFLQNLVKGTSHLSLGQEAVAAGFAAAMQPGDLSFCTYRGHAHTLARGVPIEKVLGELMQRDNGLMRGKGGSMHLTSVDHGVMGSYAIIGAHLPIACGAAWRAQYKGQKDVSVCFFGDGTTNIGAFHEALNFAAVWKLPVIFVCENNLYMEYTPIGDVTAVAHPAADRAASYGLPRIVVDGNDADVVYRTALAAYDKARAGGGPSLIECMTYRYSGHSRADPAKYRPEGELEKWKERDPIKIYRERLKQFGIGDDVIVGIETDVKRRRSTKRPKSARQRRRRRSKSSPPTFMPTEASHGGIDLSRRRGARHRAGNDARSRRGVSRRGHRQGRRRVQGDGRALRAVRPAARARHADLRAGDPRRRHGRGDDGLKADRRDHVLRFLRGLLRLYRQRIRQKPLHVERPGQMPAGGAHRQRRRRAFRRAAFAERRELVHDDPGSQGRGAVVAARRDRACWRRRCAIPIR